MDLPSLCGSSWCNVLSMELSVHRVQLILVVGSSYAEGEIKPGKQFTFSELGAYHKMSENANKQV